MSAAKPVTRSQVSALLANLTDQQRLVKEKAEEIKQLAFKLHEAREALKARRTHEDHAAKRLAEVVCSSGAAWAIGKVVVEPLHCNPRLNWLLGNQVAIRPLGAEVES